MVDPGLQWHPALYAGSAHYYAIGRINYPTALDPKPPHPMIEELIERYLGPINRARKGLLPPDKAHREDEVWRAAGFARPQRIEIPGRVVEGTSEQIVAAIFSLSGSTPQIFGDRRQAFEDDLRQPLHDANPSGIFSEQTREIAADIWRPGRPAA
jgi:hypothetical protein